MNSDLFFNMLRQSISRILKSHKITSSLAMPSAKLSTYEFESLHVSVPIPYVLHIEFNRAEKFNSMTTKMWEDMVKCFNLASYDEDVRSIVLSGRGRMFTCGLDLMEAGAALMQVKGVDAARKAFTLHKFIGDAQESCSAIDKCFKPVICAVHGACIGGGMDVITACDIRMCSEDAYFSVKEVDVGLAADMGSLQRLSKIIGNDSLVRELCYTARKFGAQEAKDCGLVSKVYKDQEEVLNSCLELAETIASKSPVAVQSTKHHLNFSRDHSVDAGLQYIQAWNSSMLQTEDLMKSAQALMMKKTPKDIDFEKV